MLKIRYKTRKGQVIKVDDRWVTSEDTLGRPHHYLIDENGEIKSGYYKGLKVGEMNNNTHAIMKAKTKDDVLNVLNRLKSSDKIKLGDTNIFEKQENGKWKSVTSNMGYSIPQDMFAERFLLDYILKGGKVECDYKGEKANDKQITELKDARNFDDVEKLLRNMGIKFNATEFNDNHMSLYNVISTLEGIQQMYQEFPEVKGYLQHIAIENDVDCDMSAEKHTIALNPKAFSPSIDIGEHCKGESYGWKDKQDKYMEATKPNKWWHRNATPSSVMIHEMGHIMHNMLAERYNKQKDETFSGTDIGFRITTQACYNLRNTEWGKGKNFAEMSAYISGYATTSPWECYAEAMADYYANGKNSSPLTQEIIRLTHKMLDETK